MAVIIKGLAEGVISAVKDWVTEQWKTISDLFKYTSLDDIADTLRKTVPIKDEMSPADVAKYPENLLRDWGASLERQKIPGVLVTPILFIIGMMTGLKALMDISAVTGEKNILQPLRKTLSPNLPDAGTVIAVELRKLLDPKITDEILARQGYSKDHIKIFRDAAKAFPSVQDIIQFAVREVYSPSAGSLGIFDELDESFLNAAKEDLQKAGISPELAKKYWGAHWTYPSPQMAFEMLHRGVIGPEQIAELLKASDYPKIWRDRLIAISYSPLTRVDVRRMHKLGVLDRAGVKKAFKDIGYDDANAESLTRFTEEYNKDPEEAEKTGADRAKEKERDLTKSDIVSAYSTGTIDAGKAKSLLTSLGYAADEIEILVGRVDFNRGKQVREKLIDAYHDLFIKGLFDKEDANEALEAIPLSASEIKELFRVWDIEKIKTIDIPTKADILRWTKKEFISKDEAKTLLLNIGTQPRFADFYLKEI